MAGLVCQYYTEYGTNFDIACITGLQFKQLEILFFANMYVYQ